jgi:hypothetical protein
MYECARSSVGSEHLASNQRVGSSSLSGRATSKESVFSIATVDAPSFVRTRIERSSRQKEFRIRGIHVLIRLMLLSFIAFRLALTSFFTNVIGIGFPFGKLTMAFVVA